MSEIEQSKADRSHIEEISQSFEDIHWTSPRPDYPSAWHGHIAFVQWLIKVTLPRVAVELGTQNGVSYAAMCHAVASLGLAARCYAVDTWKGDAQTGPYGDMVYKNLKEFNNTHFAGFSTLMRCFFDEALSNFAPGSIDLLHIDGLHTYEAVRHDFEAWLPKMSNCGVVLFHDTAVRKDDFGVWQLWEELQVRYPSFTFEHSAGLGVLIVGSSPAAAIVALCGVTSEAAVSYLRERFKALSDLARHNGFRDMGLAPELDGVENPTQRSAGPSDALTIAEAAIAERPDDPDLRGRFGYLLLGAGQVDRAIGVLQEGLERIPDDAGLLFALSNAYGHAGRSAQALDAAERAVAARPDQFHPLMHTGYLLLGAGLLDRAEVAFRNAERLQSDDVRVPAVLADVLDRLGRIEEAAGAAERAVALAPDDEALTRRLDALRDRLAAQVEPAVGALATNTQPPAAAPALAVRPSPPLAASPARPAPKRSAFGFLSW